MPYPNDRSYFDRPRRSPRERGEWSVDPNALEDVGFRRRGGWREGSDYYGDNRTRYEREGGREAHYGAREVDYGGRNNEERNESASRKPSWSRAGSSIERDTAEWRRDRDRYGGWGSLPQAVGMGHRGRGPRGYERTDERIREEVCERLTEDPMVDASSIEVTVQAGEVTLAGAVNSRLEKRRAEDIAELRGVRDVHNRLRVASERDPRQT